MGLACKNDDICTPGACAAETAPDDESATSAFVACRNHEVQIITMTLLDAPVSSLSVPLDDGTTWRDCASALAGGVTGELCTFASRSCLRKTPDTCCLEGMSCTPQPGDITSENGLLRHIRVCAPGCTEHEPAPSEQVVTDCASAAAVDLNHTTAACRGDFVCSHALCDTTVDEFTAESPINGAVWCAGGVLVGGYASSWGL
jgi:hypothetical protein